MAAAFQRFAGKTLPGSLWHAAPMIVQVAAGIAACGLWVGVASPNLQLLPGVNARSDASVEIALQSALLGIDDGSSHSASAVLAASYADLPSPAQLRRATSTPRRNLEPRRQALACHRRRRDSADEPTRIGARSRLVVPAGPPVDPQVSPAAPGGVAADVATPASVCPDGGQGQREVPPRRQKQPKPTPAAPKVVPPATVALLDQQIAFDSALPGTAYVGRTLMVSASATSGLPVTLSVAGGSNVCKLTGSALMLRSAGSLHPRGASARERQIQGAAVEGSFAVVAPQTISFDAAPAGAVVGEHYRLEARATSGLAVAVSSLTPAVCALAGPNVRTIGVGSARSRPTRPATTPSSPQHPCRWCSTCWSPTRGRARRPLCSPRLRPRARSWAALPISCRPLRAPGSLSTCSVDAASAGVCAITGNRVTFVGEGTCTVGAGQSGGHGFLAAPPVSQSILVARAPQAVSFLSTPPASAVAGLTTYLVVASSSASLPVTLSVAQSSAAVCAISGAVVTAISAGTCEVDADQPGDAALPACVPGGADVLGRQRDTVPQRPDGQLHIHPAGVGDRRRPGLCTRRDRDVRSAGRLLGRRVERRHLHRDRLHGRAHRRRHLHDLRRPERLDGVRAGRQVQQSFTVGLAAQAIAFTSVPPVPAAAGGAATPSRRPRRPD